MKSSKQTKSAAQKRKARATTRTRASTPSQPRSRAKTHATPHPRRGGRDPVVLLNADHRRLQALLKSLQSARTASRRSALIEQTADALRMHTEMEESIFYPAFRAAAQSARDRQMFHEATEEHHAVDVVLPECRSATADADVFAARAKVLRELVEHHIKEEQDVMFPRARRILSAQELHELGEEIAARQTAARTPSVVRTVGQLIGLTR